MISVCFAAFIPAPHSAACRESGTVSIVKSHPELASVGFIAALVGQVEPVVGGVQQGDPTLVGRVGVIDVMGMFAEGAGAVAVGRFHAGAVVVVQKAAGLQLLGRERDHQIVVEIIAAG